MDLCVFLLKLISTFKVSDVGARVGLVAGDHVARGDEVLGFLKCYAQLGRFTVLKDVSESQSKLQNDPSAWTPCHRAQII